MKSMLVALLSCLVVLAGCAPAATTTTTSTPNAPATTGSSSQPTAAPTVGEKRSANQVIHIAQASLPSTLSQECCVSQRPTFLLMYDMLVTLDNNLQAKPWAATKWEWIDPLTLRFYLRKDLTFSNGDKFTAADVEFEVKHMVETKTSPISRFRSIADAKMIDDYTVDLINSVPDASTLPATSYMPLIPAKYFQEVGAKGFAAKPIGTGPYVLADQQANTKLVFKLRPESHPFRKPIPTEIDILQLPDTAAVVAGLKTGDIDIATTIPFLSDQLDSLEKAGMKFQTQLSQNFHYIYPWPTWQKQNTPLKDKRVREALNYAVDKDTINKKLFRGEGKPSRNVVAPGSPFYDESLKPYPYDPAKAKQLLAEAGYPNGFDSTIATYFGCDSIYNDLGNVWYCNKEFDQLHAQANTEPDMAKRTALLNKAAKIITDDARCIFVVLTPSYKVHSKKMKGFVWGDDRVWTMDGVYMVD